MLLQRALCAAPLPLPSAFEWRAFRTLEPQARCHVP
jgi:hypothetical protein